MRIVGGTWRGRSFEAPQGRDTRPTTDRMRESIASMILSALDLDLEDCRVLDAFAGSGGMGLELLSRGAAHCTFVERDRRTAALIKRNCASLGANKSAIAVLVGDVCKRAQSGPLADKPFSCVFLDPPYAMAAKDVSQLVEDLAAQGSLAPGCLVVYERAAKAPGLSVAGAETQRTRSHGGTSVDLLRMTGIPSENGPSPEPQATNEDASQSPTAR